MFVHHWHGRRQVTLLGSGVSDRLGFLAESAYSSSFASMAMDTLDLCDACWDICDFQDLANDSPFRGAASASLTFEFSSPYRCALIDLPPSMDQLVRSLPHGLRRNLRRYRDKLARTGEVVFAAASSDASFESGIDCLIALHGARWRSMGQDGMFQGDAARFHREAAFRMWSKGRARCFTLAVDGQCIAAIYGMLDKGRFWSYQSGFHPGWARFEPGSLILEYAISEAIRERARVFDFLRGEEEYKLSWGARFEPSLRVVVSPVSPAGSGLDAA